MSICNPSLSLTQLVLQDVKRAYKPCLRYNEIFDDFFIMFPVRPFQSLAKKMLPYPALGQDLYLTLSRCSPFS